MKLLKKSFYVLFGLFFLISCTVNEKQWHESSAAMLGYKATSIYIKKNGYASVAGFINDKYIIKNFDSDGNYIKGSRKEIPANRMLNPNNFRGNKFIADMRDDPRFVNFDKLIEKFNDEVSCKD